MDKKTAVKIPMIDDLDDFDEEDNGPKVQDSLLRFSGAPAPEILRNGV